MGKTKEEGKLTTQTIHITTFYYGLYSNDLNDLMGFAMEKKKMDLSKQKITEEVEVELYKIKVLVMRILDQNFEQYKNTKKEEVTVDILYENGKPKDENELFSLLCNINGLTYPNVNMQIEENQLAQKERLKKYQALLEPLL